MEALCQISGKGGEGGDHHLLQSRITIRLHRDSMRPQSVLVYYSSIIFLITAAATQSERFIGIDRQRTAGHQPGCNVTLTGCLQQGFCLTGQRKSVVPSWWLHNATTDVAFAGWGQSVPLEKLGAVLSTILHWVCQSWIFSQIRCVSRSRRMMLYSRGWRFSNI